MGLYQNILDEVLDRIRTRQGENGMKKVYEEFKETGKEAMSKELVCRIVGKYFSAEEREELLNRHPEVRAAFQNLNQKQ